MDPELQADLNTVRTDYLDRIPAVLEGRSKRVVDNYGFV